MAESQVPYPYTETGDTLITRLSDERFAPYLMNAGRNRDYAFALYLYNARMAKAFLYPLHILEITLRNSISQVFAQSFGVGWCHDPSFRQILTKESITALDKGIDRAKSREAADIVSTLTFDFWSNLFRGNYDRSLWQTRMHDLLPNISKTRSEFQKTIKEINHFRNRIAHHEPVYKMDVSKIHTQLLEVLLWLSPDVAHWVKHFSTVNACLRSKPTDKGHSAPWVSEKADNDFCVVGLSSTLSEMATERFILCLDNSGSVIAVIEMCHIGKYLFSLRESNDLMISLADLTYVDVVTNGKLRNNFLGCDAGENLHSATAKMSGKKPYLVVQDENGICGVIAKAHRKY